jgi:hypothetical protein
MTYISETSDSWMPGLTVRCQVVPGNEGRNLGDLIHMAGVYI